MRVDRTGFAENLTTFDFVTLNTTEQSTDVVAGFRVIEQFAEHFDTGNNGLFAFFGQADDFDFFRHIQLATFHTAGSNSTTTGDGEHVFNRHQERFVGGTFRRRNVFVDSRHEFENRSIFRSVHIGRSAFKHLQTRTTDNRGVVAREFVLVEEFADFHFDEIQQFFVIDLVAFVHEHNDVRNADLTGQQDVFTGLRHRAISGRHNEDSTVHLRSTGDHVFNIVSVAGAVNVSIVTVVGFVLNVSGVDCDTTCTFFRSFIDVRVINELRSAVHVQDLSDRRSQGGFTVVNVTDGTNVYVRLSSFEFCLCHCVFPPLINLTVGLQNT